MVAQLDTNAQGLRSRERPAPALPDASRLAGGRLSARRMNAACTMKRLLVALDTTDNSSFVLARAIELATAFGAKIRLVSAVQMPPIVPAPPVGPDLRRSGGAHLPGKGDAS